MIKPFAEIEVWVYRLLIVSFFFPPHLQTWLLILCCIGVSIRAFVQKVFLSPKEFWLALLLGGGFLFYVAYLPLTPSAGRAILYSLLERKVSLFLLPFILALGLKLAHKPILPELKWFAFANMSHGILINAVIFFQSLQSSLNMNHVAYRLNFEKISDIHPTYYGMFICFAVGILLYEKSLRSLPNLAKIMGHILLVALLLFLSPKISLLILIGIYLHYFMFSFGMPHSRKLVLLLSLVSIAVLSFFFLPFFHDRLSEVFGYFFKQETNANENSLVFRQLIYQIDLNILKDAWLVGIGPVELQQNLDLAYFNLSYISKQMIFTYNTHNEYLNQWICFGLAGLLYFVSVFVLHFSRAIKQKNALYLIFLLILIISCLTENIYSRQSGIVFVAFFGPLFFFYKPKPNVEGEENV